MGQILSVLMLLVCGFFASFSSAIGVVGVAGSSTFFGKLPALKRGVNPFGFATIGVSAVSSLAFSSAIGDVLVADSSTFFGKLPALKRGLKPAGLLAAGSEASVVGLAEGTFLQGTCCFKPRLKACRLRRR